MVHLIINYDYSLGSDIFGHLDSALEATVTIAAIDGNEEVATI